MSLAARALAFAAICFGIAATTTPAAARLPFFKMKAPAAVLSLEVAHTDVERRHGLMGRTKLAAHCGMIFVFDSDARRFFWMKDTLVPLDMVFIDAAGRVTSVAQNVPATAANTREGDIAKRQGFGRFVVELPSGEAKSDGLNAGIRLRIPAFP